MGLRLCSQSSRPLARVIPGSSRSASVSVHVLLMGKWPEKAVSESSHELARLSCLVQVERAACVTFPPCAVKVTHGSGAASENLPSGAVLRSRVSKCLAAMQAAARQVKVAESVSRYRSAGRIPAWYRFRPAGWRSKGTYRVKTQASAAIICDPVFAEDCTGKRLNRPVKALLSGCEALGAVNDSIGQGETTAVSLVQKGKTVLRQKVL